MKYDAEKLKAFAAAIMQKAGLNEADSRLFADSLVKADMRGIGSHGVTRLYAYSRRIQEGWVCDAEPKVVRDGGALLAVDAMNGMGVVAAYKIMELCMRRAEETGCCFAAVNNGNHFGYAAYFTELAAKHDMIGVAMGNGPVAIAPTGGTTPMLGTNPLSVAIPAGRYRPLVLDMATSVVARGKITLARKNGQPIPLGWGVDAEGQDTDDPNRVKTVLPFGGAKGYAISLIIEVLCSCLSGAENGQTMGSFYDYSRSQQAGFFLGAINIGKIMPLAEFKESVDALFESMKESPAAAGVKEIFIPGEIEYNNMLEAEARGVVLSDAIAAELSQLGQVYGVPFACGI